MNELMPPLEAILRMCAAAKPNPWYPSVYVQATGTPRDQLDPFLDELRLGGLIQLTEWVQGTGQGYKLTPAGQEVLDTPRYLNRLRAGELPRQATREPVARDLRNARGTAWERGEAVREALLEPYTPVVTYVLIAINVLVFLAGLWLANSWQVNVGDYLKGTDRTGEVAKIQECTGALRSTDVYVRGQWWRLLTACFGHIGLLHLGSNMVSLFLVGPLLERVWGPGRFLLLYLLAGFGGSCGMLIENPTGGGAGASGAILGVLASFATWIYLNRRVLAPGLVARWRQQLVFLLVLSLAITFGVPHVSKGGHFGGGIVGLLAAVPLDYFRFGDVRQRSLALATLLVIPLACLGAVLVSFRSTGEAISYYDLHDRQFVPTYNSAVHFFNEQVKSHLPPEQWRMNVPDLPRLLDELAIHQEELTALADQVEKTGPYRNEEFEQGRREMLRDLRGLKARLGAAEEILRHQRDRDRG